MKRKYYLAYGSNLNVRQMIRRCPRAVQVGTSMVKDYQLVFRGNSQSGVANIESCTGDSVQVGIWEITPSDEKALDRYEGYPWLYEKQMFTVPFGDGELETMAYIMTPGHEIAVPTRYYLATIVEGYQDFGFNVEPLLMAAARTQKR